MRLLHLWVIIFFFVLVLMLTHNLQQNKCLIKKMFSFVSNERSHIDWRCLQYTVNLFSAQEYNLKYVDLIEEQLNEALTTYRKPVDGDNYVRRSNQRYTLFPRLFCSEFPPQSCSKNCGLIWFAGCKGRMSTFLCIYMVSLCMIRQGAIS